MTDLLARGAALDVKVSLTRGDSEDMRVQAAWSVEESGGRRTERRTDLVRQPDGSFVGSVPAEGDLMTMHVMAGDAASDPHVIRVVTAPSVVAGSMRIYPPTYASGSIESLRTSWVGSVGGTYSGILQGSDVEVDLQLATTAALPGQGRAPASPVIEMVGEAAAAVGTPTVGSPEPRRWILRWKASTSHEITVRPSDAQGVQASEPLRISPRVMTDRPPTVSVMEPEADEIATASATVAFRVDARDDLRLLESGWRLERQQRSGEPTAVTLQQQKRSRPEVEDTLYGNLDLASMQIRNGDTLTLCGFARDGRTEGEGAGEIVWSEPRRIQIVDGSTLERKVRQLADGLRQVASRLEQAQSELAADIDAETGLRSQIPLGERIRQAQAAAERLSDRLRRNGLEDQPLTEALEEAKEAAQRASERSDAASEALRSAMRGGDRGPATKAQQEARDELRRMGEALDRDDQAAAAQRRVERIAERIMEARRGLRESAQGVEGVVPKDLDEDRRRALQDQARQQRAIGDEVRAMSDELRRASEAARPQDPAMSRSMNAAAEAAEQGQVARRMEEAGDRTERNQTTAADRSMEAAQDAMERVRQALRDDRQARTEELRRRLTSLNETLETLVVESDRIAGTIDTWIGEPSMPVDSIEKPLIQLARNTASAAEEAKEGGPTLSKVTGLCTRATERQQASLSAMRQDPAAGPEAMAALTRSTELLREALAEVEKARHREAERDSRRQRQQLGKAYAEIATAVSAIRQSVASTLPPDGGRLDRRSAAAQREQGALMLDVRNRFEQGPMTSPMIVEAEVFKSIHARVHGGMKSSAAELQAADGDAGTVWVIDDVIAGLQALTLALREPEPGEDPFADGKPQAGGGAGGQGGSGSSRVLPPIAELRLVREMQAHVNRITEGLADSAPSDPRSIEALREVGRLQDEVQRLGEDWIDRMERMNPRGAGQTRPPSMVPSRILGRGQAASPSPRAEPPPERQDEPAKPASPRSLDELLGITPDGGADSAASRKRQDELDRTLRRQDLDDLARSATESMRTASRLMVESGDAGLGTRRAQAQALADIDALLDAANRMQRQQQQQQSGSSSEASGRGSMSRSSRGAPQQAEKVGPPPSNKGDDPSRSNRDSKSGQDGMSERPPEATDDSAKADGSLEEGRSEWGRLPPRIREILSQSRRDRVSALYQQATEAYYRRLAEERGP